MIETVSLSQQTLSTNKMCTMWRFLINFVAYKESPRTPFVGKPTGNDVISCSESFHSSLNEHMLSSWVRLHLTLFSCTSCNWDFMRSARTNWIRLNKYFYRSIQEIDNAIFFCYWWIYPSERHLRSSNHRRTAQNT